MQYVNHITINTKQNGAKAISHFSIKVTTKRKTTYINQNFKHLIEIEKLQKLEMSNSTDQRNFFVVDRSVCLRCMRASKVEARVGGKLTLQPISWMSSW